MGHNVFTCFVGHIQTHHMVSFTYKRMHSIATGTKTDTNIQSPYFYKRMGYEVFGILDDYPI